MLVAPRSFLSFGWTCRGVDEDIGKMRILLLQQIGFALPGMFFVDTHDADNTASWWRHAFEELVIRETSTWFAVVCAVKGGYHSFCPFCDKDKMSPSWSSTGFWASQKMWKMRQAKRVLKNPSCIPFNGSFFGAKKKPVFKVAAFGRHMSTPGLSF